MKRYFDRNYGMADIGVAKKKPYRNSLVESQAQSMSTDQAGSAESVVGPLAIDHSAIVAQALGHH
ncbi:hypothetical protein TorRG33x02_043430 [Trema orientale]|uniref:Uncharacterized protein n=1 Tax=Trema orientale TaxID=63057 RepID=A0A2P5FQ50_TREOI|nr:hypothetical protein TorRG33x02_043430 [Trema orientale]